MHHGLIVSSYGRQFIVEYQGQQYQAVTKGKKTEFVVGDKVKLNLINDKQVQIMELIPRENLIYRSDLNRSKIIASNLDQIIIVIAVKPNFNQNFLDSCLICAESSQITPLILINKMDLIESAEFASKIQQLYGDELGYPILELSAVDNCQQLMPYLTGKRNLLIGQSGVGKSTITNQIFPEAKARTAEITKYETSGSHTTTSAALYHIAENTDLIDCPGLQEFGLFHLELTEFAEYFPDLRNYLGQCKFNNCVHLNEPNCAILAALKAGKIQAHRYAFYKRITESYKLKKNY